MRSNYRKIGDYIELVDERNKDLSIDLLLGLSINKQFIPSVANIVGANMTNYKIIRKGQFACSIMQVRRDKKMPVAFLEDFEEAIISQAYPVFRIKDERVLLPKYLMMWFTRSEFDRHACFLAVGGVRGSLEWEDFLEMELPIPSIEKQREIVKEYNTVVNRIKLNEQLNKKLEETAQALYKHWFVDFEFPISAEQAAEMGNPELEGKPYKSFGGKMVWNEELGKEVPEGWEVKNVKGFTIDMKSGGTPNRMIDEYWDSEEVPWLKTGELKNSIVIDSEEYISRIALKKSSAKILPVNTVLIAMYGEGKTKGQVGYLKKEASTNQACCAMICENEEKASFLYYHLRTNRDEIVSIAIGGAQPNLSKNIIEEIRIIEPNESALNSHPFIQILKSKEGYTKEIKSLEGLRNLFLSKMTQVEIEEKEVVSG
ncbi:MAG: restriction endonuclease subunit S [Fulvivirga sp.]